ncbi:chemotaxis protein CheW [Pseudomonas sp. ODNR1LW]|nr:chemotaxis protein CheW [Pseudomonas sp. ODNR1LW]
MPFAQTQSNPLSVSASAAGRREMVGFRVGEQAFCIDITSVLEIRGWTPATPVPQCPAYMKGVVNLRGSVLPIIDLAARLGLPTTEPSARHAIMVVDCGGRTVGLLVEGVSDIVQLDDGARQATPDLGQAEAGFVAGIFAVDGDMISLLKLDALLQQERRDSSEAELDVRSAA